MSLFHFALGTHHFSLLTISFFCPPPSNPDRYSCADPYWLAQRPTTRPPGQAAAEARRFPNVRKVDELPWLRREACQWEKLEELWLSAIRVESSVF